MADAATWIGTGVALTVGLWGAGLSTYNTLVRRRERKESATRDVVITGNARPVAGDPHRTRYTISAVNNAVRPVEIRRVGVVGDRNICVWFGPTVSNLPARLEDGQSVTIEVTEEWIGLVRLSTQQQLLGYAAEDSLGNIYSSETAPAIISATEMGFLT